MPLDLNAIKDRLRTAEPDAPMDRDWLIMVAEVEQLRGRPRHAGHRGHRPGAGGDEMTSRPRADRHCPICHAQHPHHADEKRTVHICQTHRGRHLHEVEPGRWRLFDHVQEDPR